VTWSTTTVWITLTAGPKHAATIFTISHLYFELHQVGLVWFWGFAWSLSWLAGVLSTLPNPLWLDPSASDRAQRLGLQTPTSNQAVLEQFVVVGDGKGSHFTHLLPNALHLSATLSSSNSALLPPIKHANAF
jgi:hypothetical protein